MRRFLCFLIVLSFGQLAWSSGLAPEFRLPALDGSGSHALSDYRGKVIYLDFWASWCGPCQQSLPALDALQKEYSPEDFQVIAINLDESPEEARAFLQKFPVDYVILSELSGKTQRAYNLVGLPSSFLIDQKGEVIGSFQGFHPGHIKRLKKAIGYLLEE